MTNTKFLFIVSLIISMACFSTQTNAQNWKTKGNNVKPNEFIGSKNNANLDIRTHDTTRMLISNNGNIHIMDSLNVDSVATFRGLTTFTRGGTDDDIIMEPNLTGFPSHDDIWFSTNTHCIMGAHKHYVFYPFLWYWQANSLAAFGVSTQHPNYMLDVKCDPSFPSKSDINVFTTAPFQNVGYRIGDSMIIWHNGIITSLFTGVYAGGTNPSGVANTFTGNLSGYYNAADSNTYTGWGAGYGGTGSNVGTNNTFTGVRSGFSNLSGNDNTFTGHMAGYSNTGVVSTPEGSFNTFTGVKCGFYNTTGHHNEFYGKKAGYHNVTGWNNCYYGTHSDFWSLGADSNVCMGTQVGFNEQGGDNVMMGWEAGAYGGISFKAANPYTSYKNIFIGSYAAHDCNGSYNIIMGSYADAANNINNAGAIGYQAAVEHTNHFILGNNLQFVGIGLSADPTGPQANLEIRTDLNPNPPPIAGAFIGKGTATTNNFYYNGTTGTGFSGLRLTDLTAFSTPDDLTTVAAKSGASPTGVLSVDGFGNVIYVPAPNGIGTCGAPTTFPTFTDGAIDLHNQNNFYFTGNGQTSAYDNVVIGLNCAPPIAKLQVYQHSTSFDSKGIYVQNDDMASGTYGFPTELIGLQSYIPPNTNGLNNLYNIAGWFNADNSPNTPQQYAIFVPPAPSTLGTGATGGMVSIGWPLGSFTTSPILLAVNGPIITNASYIPSDSILKDDISPLSHGLDVVRQLHPVSYKYNGKGGMDSAITYYGLVAESVQRVAPYAVDSAAIVLDSGDAPTPILTLNQEAISYTAINALKQLDAEINGGGTTGILVADSTGTLYQRTDTTTTQLAQVGANSFATSSDARFKTSVSTIPNALAIIDSLNGVYFNWNQTKYPWKHFSSNQQAGFIAQQVLPFAPQVVTKDDSGYYAVDYGRITPYLVNALKQEQDSVKAQEKVNNAQQLTIDSLRTMLNSIQSCINKVCAADTNKDEMIRKNNDNGNQQDVTLSNSAILYQNAPNPFGSSGTKINYYLPEGTVGASIVFYDTYGNRLKEVQLTQTGMGAVNVNPSQLSNGIYTYSLIINGNIVDTKKMVFAK